MPIPDAYDGTLALTLSRGLHVVTVSVSCQSWRHSARSALGRCIRIDGWQAGRNMIS